MEGPKTLANSKILNRKNKAGDIIILDLVLWGYSNQDSVVLS